MSPRNKPTEQKRAPKTVAESDREMIGLAIELTRKKLIDGTAPAPLIMHYVKLGTAMAELETKKLEFEIALLAEKAESLKSTRNIEDLYSNAIKAMGSYRSLDDGDTDVDV